MNIDQQTTLAVGELVQAAAHFHGIVGPVEYHVICSNIDYEKIANDLDDTEAFDV